MLRRRPFIAATLALAATTSLPSFAQDNWPSKPVKLISPFPAGGTSDVMARMIAEALTKELGQQFVVDNIGGAGGTIGTLRAAKSTPDGYTIVQTGVGQNAVAHGLDPKLQYDSMRDFVHLAQVHSGPNVLVVHPGTPFKTFKEFVEYVRKNPGKLNYGYTHAASGHMAMELLKQRASECPKGVKECNGFFMVGIPYRGGGPMLQDLLGGQFPLMFINQDVALPHVKAGKLRVLAVMSPERISTMPDVPTIAESGYPGFEASVWHAFIAPRGTPPAVVDRLNAEVRKALAQPDVKERFAGLGAEVAPTSPEQLGAIIRSERERYDRLIRDAKIRVD